MNKSHWEWSISSLCVCIVWEVEPREAHYQRFTQCPSNTYTYMHACIHTQTHAHKHLYCSIKKTNILWKKPTRLISSLVSHLIVFVWFGFKQWLSRKSLDESSEKHWLFEVLQLWSHFLSWPAWMCTYPHTDIHILIEINLFKKY